MGIGVTPGGVRGVATPQNLRWGVANALQPPLPRILCHRGLGLKFLKGGGADGVLTEKCSSPWIKWRLKRGGVDGVFPGNPLPS